MSSTVLIGIVSRESKDKTVKVCVTIRVPHPRYGKIVRRLKNYLAHDPSNNLKVGDPVKIRVCAPLSLRKSWECVYD